MQDARLEKGGGDIYDAQISLSHHHVPIRNRNKSARFEKRSFERRFDLSALSRSVPLSDDPSNLRYTGCKQDYRGDVSLPAGEHAGKPIRLTSTPEGRIVWAAELSG